MTVERWWRLPVTADVALAVAVAATAVAVDVFGPGRHAAGAAPWDVVLAAPLVARRRRPAVTAGVLAALCLLQWAVGVRATGDVAFLVALFSLAAYGRDRRTLVAGVLVAQIGIAMAVARWGPATGWESPALFSTGTVTACWVVGVYVRMRRDYVASITERAEAAERDRDSRALVAVAAERARIAREMHDVIAHSLSIMITLNDAAAAVEPSPRAQEAITQASEVGRHALAEMQRLVGVLRHDDVAERAPQPGVAQLPDLVSKVRASGLAVELAVTGELGGLAETAQLALYRIVQESLTNVVKHAHNCRRVRVAIARRDDCVTFQVVDDGWPSDRRTDPVGATGHGRGGMCERARLFGGNVTAGPGRDGGWTVRGYLRLDPEPA